MDKSRSRLVKMILIAASLVAILLPLPMMAQSGCEQGSQTSGAIYRICMPPASVPWNGELVVYAHGYVAPNEPSGIPEDQLVLPDGTSIPAIVNGLGYAFATTSYSKNGLAVLQGIKDVRDLVSIFKQKYPNTSHVYLIGASEGGLITTLAVEQSPQDFSGGLALCGPVGDFRRQINYWGDFRVVFDYFFPGILPPSPVNIPEGVIKNWEGIYVPAIKQAISSNAHATEQLLNVTRAPIDPHVPNSTMETVIGLLWYSVFATNEGIKTLGGQPFDNQGRFYCGSDNDFRLNRLVQRFTAAPAALAEMAAHYQTSGRLQPPLVTLHTTGDPIVPYWHEPLYSAKIIASGSSLLHSNIPIRRYGHCNFKAPEALVGFGLLVVRVTGQEWVDALAVLPEAASQEEFLSLARKHGLLRPLR